MPFVRTETAALLRHYALILATGVFVFFVGLGAAKLWDEDEAEYTRCAREMMARGDWVVPTLNGEPWLEKPVLVYWMMIGSFHVFGPTEFAARFPSALLAVGTSLLTYHLGRRLFRPQVGLWAALILSSSLMFVVIARAATFDSALIFFMTASLLAYVVAMPRRFWSSAANGGGLPDEIACRWFGDASSRLARFRAVLPASWLSFLAIYLPLGLAVMVKGPIGVLLPIAALGMFVWTTGSRAAGARDASPIAESALYRLRRELRRGGQRLTTMAAEFPAAAWAMRPLTLAAIVVAVSAPWYILAGIHTHGDFWRVFIWEHNVQYILHPHQGHNGSGIYYYPLALIIGFFPWTLALGIGAIAAIRRIRAGGSGRRAAQLAIAWSLTWMIVMSMVGTKLPHYIVPAFPMMAVMAAVSLVEWVESREPAGRVDRLMSAGLASLCALGIAIAVALPPLIDRWAPGRPSFNWLGIVLAVGAAVSLVLQRFRRRALSVSALAATAAILFVAIFAAAAPVFSVEQTSVQMTGSVDRLGTKSTAIGIYRLYLPGLIYYADRVNPILNIRRPSDAAELARNRDYLIVTDEQGLADLRPFLPRDAVVLENQTRFLKGTPLVVIGRSATIAAADSAKAQSLAGRSIAKPLQK